MTAAALDDLLEAAVSPPDRARDAWLRWAAVRDIEAVRWDELRLLGAVASRADELGVEAALRPRLEGVRRYVWSRTQLKLAAALPVLRRLVGDGVPFALLKGAGLIAAGVLGPGARFIRDVDLLVPREHLGDAVASLFELGWKAGRYGSAEEVFSLGFPRCHAVSFQSPGDPDDEIDLHRTATSLNPFPNADRALWSRLEERAVFGTKVGVPSAADLLCISLIHSHASDRQDGLDWAIDTAALCRSGRVDWKAFVEECHDRAVEGLAARRLERLVSLDAIALDPAVERGLGAGATGDRVPPLRTRATRHLERLGTPRVPPPLPRAAPWLRADVMLPELAGQGEAETDLVLRGRIRHARSWWPIRYRLYCGSTRLAGGYTWPNPVPALMGHGPSHALHVRSSVDPIVVRAEARPDLSLYLGRRSRATGALGPEVEIELAATARPRHGAAPGRRGEGSGSERGEPARFSLNEGQGRSPMDLDETRRSLEARLATLTGRVGKIETDLRAPALRDSEEQAIVAENDEVLERLSDAERREIDDIRAALARIEDGTYGVCAECGDEIAADRLRAVPSARLCVDCAP
jgi:RNA polymerase-binding protein DksA